MNTEWIALPDERNPEYPDAIPNESTVIATVISRTCPACGINPAAEGDRYCTDCGSAPDRSAWVDGPPPMTEWQRQDLLDEIEFDLL